jgi:uncharacterized Zn ribbon protein
MLKCPICNAELSEKDKDNLMCSECGEEIPKIYAKESKIPCCDPLNSCRK